MERIVIRRHMKPTARVRRRAPYQTAPQEIQSLQRRLALVRKLERTMEDHAAALRAIRPAIHLLRTIPSGAARSENDPASCRSEAAPEPTPVVSRGLTKSRQGF
jgi:hypothetical protein